MREKGRWRREQRERYIKESSTQERELARVRKDKEKHEKES